MVSRDIFSRFSDQNRFIAFARNQGFVELHTKFKRDYFLTLPFHTELPFAYAHGIRRQWRIRQ
jgi:hypothetical protein